MTFRNHDELSQRGFLMSASLNERLGYPRPLLLDGATGTELARMGLDLSGPSWTAAVIRRAPERLIELHTAYVDAGSEMITANTFRTHARNLVSLGWDAQAAEVTREAVELARIAAQGRAFVAGSMAPLEDCYSPALTPSAQDLVNEHRQMAESLAAAGVDLILIETQITVREAAIAARAARETGVPFAVSFTTRADGCLLSGEVLSDAVAAVEPLGPVAILLNCIPPDEILGAFGPLLHADRSFRLGAYANTGRLTPTGSWVPTGAENPAVYAEHVPEWIRAGLSWIGGCCGTTPQHISAIHDVLYGESDAHD